MQLTQIKKSGIQALVVAAFAAGALFTGVAAGGGDVDPWSNVVAGGGGGVDPWSNVVAGGGGGVDPWSNVVAGDGGDVDPWS
ncbi:hypothetical protein ACKI1I_25955 [Streptomyces turgidiscabies]|uniref:Uncharacterized protein n=1 Tax=Streptomyces turgidiscabies (strain Car8) TaxID=698760 RepID=L7EVA4_STRT8|nr:MULTISPECIES: hypothetical protein [Streptomyces]ELP63353.1 hypothetical protein STRTUCAR8_08129 [Streptomyces turgidiscabies Car8]MDX3498494.1 hypothetical protein [Streptomyces turgidiscabies]GAQ73709.1 hypothetical protein T45_05470 [Streptomyces turgidiscabies]